VGRNILIVESNNDKYFFQSVIKHLNYNIEIEDSIFLEKDCRDMDGLNPDKLTKAIKDLKADIQKEDIDRVGIIIDIDRHSETERIKFINDCIVQVFPDTVPLDRVNQFIDLKFDDCQVQLACYFTNVEGRGELDTVLRAIKCQDSTYADCLESWRECLKNNGKEISDKDFDKFWVANYTRYDTCTKKEKKQAGSKCTLAAALQTKAFIWNLEDPILDELKVFFRLFNDSSQENTRM
jgi:uncharacterized protein YqgV (UPF0045/DUF77 family)